MPKSSKRPFLLALLGFGLVLAGSTTTLRALIGLFEMLGWGPVPDSRFWAGEILVRGAEGLMALSIAYAIWKERAWGRPALLAFVLLADVIQIWLRAADAPSLLDTVLSVAFASWYLYMWPTVVDYYQSLRAVDPMPVQAG